MPTDFKDWTDAELAEAISGYERDPNFASGAWAAGRFRKAALAAGADLHERMKTEVKLRAVNPPVEIYSSPRCCFNYCPSPDECKKHPNGCAVY